MLLHNEFWWVSLLLALILWIGQNAQHEGAHALMIKRFGGVLLEMRLLPSMSEGKFYFAYVVYRGAFSSGQSAAISIAPQALNTAILCLLTILYWAVDLPAYLLVPVAAVFLLNLVDGGYNLSTFYRRVPKLGTDGWAFQEGTGINPWTLRIVTVIWQALFVAQLFV